MSTERPKFLAELKELTPEDVISGFIALRSKLDLDLLEGFLKKDPDKTTQFFNQFPFQELDPFKKNERNALTTWALNYFRDFLNADKRQAENILKKYSSRELILLGYVYKYDLGIKIIKNKEHAFNYFQLAAHLGDPIAMWLVGKCYRDGKGISSNPVIAKIYIEKASQLDCPQAVEGLVTSLSVDNHDDQQMILNLRFQAAEAGVARAYHTLALSYQSGVRGLPKDSDMDRKCCAYAAIRGNNSSIEYYSNFLSTKQKLQCLRLAAPQEKKCASEALENLDKISKLTPDLIYHATFLINSISSTRFPEYKGEFSDLCETQPDEIERLSQELGDTDGDIFSLLDDARQNKLLCAFILESDVNGLATPLLKIICEFLVKDLEKLLEKEINSKIAVKALVAQQFNQGFFSTAAKFAERGKISYQSVMQKSF